MNRSNRFRGRIKDPPAGLAPGPVFFHCMSRVVAGARLLKPVEQEVFRRMMRRQAAFCGVEILTYAVMSNHFHLLVRVDPPRKLDDETLIARVGEFYGDSKARLVRRWLADPLEGPRVRERLQQRMNDVSFFMKELKQRFMLWYNHRHDRFGTFWAEKFKSVLVEGDREVLMRVAGYIDLNPLRAGLCADPKDYRFCGYGEAVAGDAAARRGLGGILGTSDWRSVQRAYRLLLFGTGYHAKLDQGRISEAELRRILKEKGELSAAERLRCRTRFFTEGMVLGTEAFVAAFFFDRVNRYWKKRKRATVPVPYWDDLSGLNQLRRE